MSRRSRHYGPGRPRTLLVLVATQAFLGLAALAGGIEMLVWRHGGTYLPPERLDKIPFLDSYLLPGLILAGVFGLGSLVSAYGMLHTPSWRGLEPLQRRTGIVVVSGGLPVPRPRPQWPRFRVGVTGCCDDGGPK